MIITREPKGMAADKSSALTLTIASVPLASRDGLVVGITYDAGQGAPIVTWGSRRLKPQKTIAHGGVVTRFVYLRYLGDVSRTRPIVATWDTTAPMAKAMFATGVTSSTLFGVPDAKASQGETGTSDPDSGAAVLVAADDELLLGAFGSEGPIGDTIGTVQNGWTSGQRAGTTGGTAESNVTIHEAWKIVSTAEPAAAAKTGATSRDWATVMMTLRPSTEHRQGVCTTDLYKVREIFENANLKADDMVFLWNDAKDRWEAYESDLAGATLKAHLTTPGWVLD